MKLRSRLEKLEKTHKSIEQPNAFVLDVVVDRVDGITICESDVYPIIGIKSSNNDKWLKLEDETNDEFIVRFEKMIKGRGFSMYEYILDKK